MNLAYDSDSDFVLPMSTAVIVNVVTGGPNLDFVLQDVYDVQDVQDIVLFD